MKRFDQTLMEPTAAELSETLAAAVAAANENCRKYQIVLSTAKVRRLIADVTRRTESLRHESGGDSGPAKAEFSFLDIAWFTDAIGRKHVRILAQRVEQYRLAEWGWDYQGWP